MARLWDQEDEDDKSDAGDHQGGVHEAQGPVLVGVVHSVNDVTWSVRIRKLGKVSLIHRELPRIFSSRTELAPGHFSPDMGDFSYVCLKLKKVVVLN